MIVDQIDIAGVPALETEDDAPVTRYCHGPVPGEIASQPMQSVAGQAHVGWFRCFLKTGKNSLDLIHMIRLYPPSVSSLEKELKAFVAEANDHTRSVTHHLSRYNPKFRKQQPLT